MGARDKIEPFWARPSRKRGTALPPLAVPDRAEPEAPPKTPAPAASAAEEPREPSFAISGAERRDEIAAIIAGFSELSVTPASEPAAAPDAQGWIKLSAAEAARHRLYGLRGWLVVLAIFVAIGLFMGLVELIDFWATTDHGGLAAWIMAILRSVMVLWVAVVLGLLIGLSRAFPTNFVAYTMVNVIYLGLFGLAFAHVTHGAVFTGVAVAIPLNLLAIAYVLHSRRVNVTYRRRVRAKKTKDAGTPPPAGAEASHA